MHIQTGFGDVEHTNWLLILKPHLQAYVPRARRLEFWTRTTGQHLGLHIAALQTDGKSLADFQLSDFFFQKHLKY